jgi:pyridoxamine 5'-phosphate oxidase
MMTETLQALRQDYAHATLDESEVAECPFVQFAQWFAEAQAAQIHEPNAMVLATATASGRPSSRTVLLKALDDRGHPQRGFSFFTNFRSHKGQNLAENPWASVTFLWKELERQVHVMGRVVQVDRSETLAYFAQRPHRSQLGAVASAQSTVLPSRAALERSFANAEAAYPVGAVPCPETWGGYRLIPLEIEFWQGRPSRLHDRVRYSRNDLSATGWRKERLSP